MAKKPKTSAPVVELEQVAATEDVAPEGWLTARLLSDEVRAGLEREFKIAEGTGEVVVLVRLSVSDYMRAKNLAGASSPSEWVRVLARRALVGR